MTYMPHNIELIINLFFYAKLRKKLIVDVGKYFEKRCI